MPCREWRDLLQQYRRALKSYYQAIERLGMGPGPQFDEFWQQSEIARTRTEMFRSSLLNHEHKHGCLVQGDQDAWQPFPADADELVLHDQPQSGD